MKVLVAGEFSGRIRTCFEKKGHSALSCDLLPSEIPGNHWIGDVRHIINDGWDLLIAHPYCTYTAVSGARWFKYRQKEQKEGIEFFMFFVNAPIGKICVEHPVSIMSTVYRKPDQIIQPWQFGHGETKATCLWYKNLPLLIPTKIVNGREARVHKEPPSKDRWKNRSRTYWGIAEAMASQWS